MPEHLRILVVEDDDALRDALLITLEAAGHEPTGVGGGREALAALTSEAFSMVVSDLRMMPMDGLALLGEIRARHPGLPVLLMTAFGDVNKAVEAMRGGACDFMLKPFEPKALLEQIERYAVPPPAEGVVAVDPAMTAVLLLAARVARTDATVMLTGESGSGKEVLARYIHDQSPRRGGPFVAINCAAIPENLLEATLFGHEKGAFTGAQAAQAGKFEQADHGTLLLDEISEMPLGLQAKLLRVLQEREVERVGGRRPTAVDIRVLATSNRDMKAEVAAGRFREDLFYRLNVFPIHLPALRERPADVLPLAEHLLAGHAARLGLPARLVLSPAAKAIIAAHPWPGNVRELDNVLQRAAIMATGATIEPAHLALPGGEAAGQPMPRPHPAVPVESVATPAAMRDLERQHILETLAKVGGSRRRAVELLGISERTLRYKLAQYRAEGLTDE
jgi:two-component system response regulator FlrC